MNVNSGKKWMKRSASSSVSDEEADDDVAGSSSAPPRARRRFAVPSTFVPVPSASSLPFWVGWCFSPCFFSRQNSGFQFEPPAPPPPASGHRLGHAVEGHIHPTPWQPRYAAGEPAGAPAPPATVITLDQSAAWTQWQQQAWALRRPEAPPPALAPAAAGDCSHAAAGDADDDGAPDRRRKVRSASSSPAPAANRWLYELHLLRLQSRRPPAP